MELITKKTRKNSSTISWREISLGRFFCTIFLIFSLPLTAITQSSDNPFELVPRIDPKTLEQNKDTTPQNPFDIVAPPVTSSPIISRPYVVTPESSKIDEENRFKRFLFLVFSLDLILLAMFVILFNEYFIRIFEAFRSDNLMSQLYRERETGLSLPIVILYSIFFINAGIFAFLAIHYFDVAVSLSNWQLLLSCIGAITAIYLVKHIFLSLVSFVLPVERQVKLYSFSINIFNIITGLTLIPFNLFIGFGPSGSTSFFVYFGIIIIVLLLIFRYLRALAIANRYISLHLFHFLLYICTTEIVPLVILYKIFKDQFLLG